MMNLAILLCVFLPLLASAVVGLSTRTIGVKRAQLITCGGMGLSLLCALGLFCAVALSEHPFVLDLATWIQSGNFSVDWALKVDTLTAVMLVVVTLVSTMVHIYSVGYMSHDDAQPRFFAYLSFFTFCMLMLVTSDNLLQMFFGWEGVGLASYLLINFWYKRDSANNAAVKAFVVNRVGDVGFALGIMAVYALFGSVEFKTILNLDSIQAVAGQQFDFLLFHGPALTICCLLLFIGAMGKSAQLGLHTWLPDAMEGPTPVSALIHAATMVTAGVFMVCRLSPLFEQAPGALAFVAILGALTAIVAATIGLTQFDIKRVIAYSTMSQLGYMFFAAGVSAYGAAMFHLTTHAFFKALLFLGAGSVIHAQGGEQDMRRMGGIWRIVPYTYSLMWIGSLALAGIGIPMVFGFAGYYSKDTILEAAFANGEWPGLLAYWLGVAAAFLTAFYSWRLIIMTFHGPMRGNAPEYRPEPHVDHPTPRPADTMAVAAHHPHTVDLHGDSHAHEGAHESPPVMLWPLVPLALGAIFAGIGLFHWFVGEGRELFWGAALYTREGHDGIEGAHHAAAWVGILPLVAAVSGIALAYLFYSVKPDLPRRTASAFGAVYRTVYNKYYFDELYRKLFVRPAVALGLGFWQIGDTAIIDGLGPDGVARAAQNIGGRVSRWQSGLVTQYAMVLVVGLLAFSAWLVWR